MIKLGIVGCMGRMGSMNILETSKDKDFVLSSALEMQGHESIGKDISSLLNTNAKDVFVTDDVKTFLENCDTIIDFTIPPSSLNVLKEAVKQNKKYVLGTTGFSVDEIKLIEEYSKSMPILFASNMSIGMNVLFKLVYEASKMLEGYDIEIIEKHHNKKKDSPSGSAITLAQNVANALNLDMHKSLVHGRSGFVGERTEKEIGMHAVRGGDIVGEHTVLFAGDGETVELLHRATSRGNFSKGALTASKWLADKNSGLYSMADVIGSI